MRVRVAVPKLFGTSRFWAVVAVAFVVRLIWIALVDPPVALVDDAGYYDFFAVSIKEGHGYVRPEGTPTAFWPVGYPGTLAAVYGIFGHSLFAAKLLNAVLGAATAGIVYLLARRWLGPWQATAAGLIYACFPGAIGFTSLTMSETLFTFLFIAALYLVARAAESRSHDLLWAVGFAVLAGAAVYVRGQALALPFLAAVWLLIAGWAWHRVVSYLAVSFAVVIALSVPWLVRNTVTFDEPTFLSTNFGLNFWVGHNPGADGGLNFQQQLEFAGAWGHLPLDEQELAWNRDGFRQGLRYMVNHPLDEVRLTVQKIAKLYSDDADALRWNEQNGGAAIFSASERRSLRVLFDGYFYVVGAATIAALSMGLLRRERWLGPMASALVLWTLGHAVFFGEPRLHVPVLPLFSIAATVPLVEALRLARSARRRPALAPTAAKSPATRV